MAGVADVAVSRRGVVGVLAALGAVALGGCSSDGSRGSAGSAGGGTSRAGTGSQVDTGVAPTPRAPGPGAPGPPGTATQAPPGPAAPQAPAPAGPPLAVPGLPGGVPARPHVLARASDVPPGTGLVVDGPAGIGPVVLAQPQPGTVKAFAAVCTHEPTPLGPPGGGSITCPRCGSQYVPATGAVSHGPATRPLRQIAVLVQDGTVLIT